MQSASMVRSLRIVAGCSAVLSGLVLSACSPRHVEDQTRPAPLASRNTADAIRVYVGHRSALARQPVTVVVCQLPDLPPFDETWARDVADRSTAIGNVRIVSPCTAETPWLESDLTWPVVRVHSVRTRGDTIWVDAVSGQSASDRTLETAQILRIGDHMMPLTVTIGITIHDNRSPRPVVPTQP